jgi:hypothetical protein
MTVKDRLQQITRAGMPPVDIYGTAWGQILNGIDPAVLTPSGHPSIAIPAGIPDA